MHTHTHHTWARARAHIHTHTHTHLETEILQSSPPVSLCTPTDEIMAMSQWSLGLKSSLLCMSLVECCAFLMTSCTALVYVSKCMIFKLSNEMAGEQEPTQDRNLSFFGSGFGLGLGFRNLHPYL